MTADIARQPRKAAARKAPAHGAKEHILALTMRELGKLTVDQVNEIDHPVPITSNGKPVAWLVPLTPAERRRAELIASGRLEPRRRDDLEAWQPLPPATGAEPTLTEILNAMREQERT
jgi:prevent-host-death family protein